MENKLEIIKIKTTNIKPYWRNARDNRKTIEMIKDSISLYGFTNPILLDKNNVIIAGHARYKALVELDWEYIDCIILDLTEEKAKQYRIADNKIHEATEWDLDELGKELRELDLDVMQKFFKTDIKLDLGKDLDFKLGFNVTNEDIKKTQDRLDIVNREIAENDQNRKVEVICPYCQEAFYLNKEDI
jgi:ParB-like chromosome segregation protein Spo0J